MLQSIAKNADCSSDEATKCVMYVLFARFGKVFAGIAIREGYSIGWDAKKNGHS
jgi:hypothetical protein